MLMDHQSFYPGSPLLPQQFISPLYIDSSLVPFALTVHQSPLTLIVSSVDFTLTDSSIHFTLTIHLFLLYWWIISPFYADRSSVPFTLMDHQSLFHWWIISPFFTDVSSVPFTLMDHKALLLWWIISHFYSDGSSVPFTLMDHQSLLLWWIISPFHADGSSVPFTLTTLSVTLASQSILHWQFTGPFYPDIFSGCVGWVNICWHGSSMFNLGFTGELLVIVSNILQMLFLNVLCRRRAQNKHKSSFFHPEPPCNLWANPCPLQKSNIIVMVGSWVWHNDVFTLMEKHFSLT